MTTICFVHLIKVSFFQTWNKVAETLSTVGILTLWNSLLSRRTRDTEELMALGIFEIANNNNERKSGEDIDIGVARVCGQFVATAAQRLIYRAKINDHEKLVIKYIEKIEVRKVEQLLIVQKL